MIEEITPKEKILLTAKDLFGKHGFTKVKTDDIAGECGISKRTLYSIFPSKVELFDEVINSVLIRIRENIRTMIERLVKNENCDFVEELLNIRHSNFNESKCFSIDCLDDIKKNLPGYWKKINDFRDEQMKESFRNIYRIGIDRGYFKSHINENIMYLIHYVATQYILLPEVVIDLPFSRMEIAHTIYEVILTGTLTDKGRSVFNEIKVRNNCIC